MKLEQTLKTVARTPQRSGKIKIDLERRAEIGRERRQKKLLEVLRRIIDYLANQPLRDTNIEDVAAAAGISTRSFYNYFAKKEDIANAIDILLNHIGECNSNRHINIVGSLPEEVAFMILSNLQFARHNPALAKVSFDLYLDSYPKPTSFWIAANKFYEGRYKRGVREKTFVKMENRLHSEFVWTPLFSLTSRLADEAESRRDELMKAGAMHALMVIGVERQSAKDAVDAAFSQIPQNEQSVLQNAFQITVDAILAK